MKSTLFSPFALRGVEFRHRIFCSPMCQYSSRDGVPGDWHMVHLGSRAVGGFACVIQEATAVSADGRISPGDAGLWNDAQKDAYRPIVQFIRQNGAVAGIQLAHAGRKGSTPRPWEERKILSEEKGGWDIAGPSAIAFDDTSKTPRAMEESDIRKVVEDFVAAAGRSREAGYDLVEIHAAHGYLLHEFLSPLSNRRTDRYGGSLENRMRLTLEVADAVRSFWPKEAPVFVRISASDWADSGGWDLEQSIELCKRLKAIGIDLIDTSSGGTLAHAKIPSHPGYQVPFSAAIREQAQMPTGAVGLITDAIQAEQIVANGQADVVLLAREALRDPYWPMHAAQILKADIAYPVQYERAKPR